MRGIKGWDSHPYHPYNRKEEQFAPYICRLAPAEHSIDLQILDNAAPDAARRVRYRKVGTEAWQAEPMTGCTHTICGLDSDCEYELVVCRAEDEAKCSRVRLARTGFYPDTIVNYLHPEDKQYDFSGHALCSPTIAKLPSGTLLTAMDVFEGERPQNLTLIFRSRDNGKSWEYVCDLFPAFWGTLFVHRGVVYLLGTTTENGHLVIGATYDEGDTWTKPTMILPGGAAQSKSPGWQREPMPIVAHNGYLRTCVEYGCWSDPKLFGVGILSVPEDADLLVSENWVVSDLTYYDRSWKDSPTGKQITILEGSLYVAKDGKLLDLMRMNMYETEPKCGKACLLEIDPDDLEAAPKFHSIIDMPTGTNHRTHVLYDAVSGKYWAMGNLNDATREVQRSILSLCVSDDGYSWRLVKNIHDCSHMDVGKVGFNYMSFVFAGEDILYVSRTAYNGAHNFHDANCQTFGVVKDFRKLAES